MVPSSENLEIRRTGIAIVARITGKASNSLYESNLITSIGASLYELARQNPASTIVVNLEKVQYASTEMIAKLVSLNSRLERGHGRLILCGLQPDVRESLRILKLLSLFYVADSESDALKSGDPSLHQSTLDHPVID